MVYTEFSRIKPLHNDTPVGQRTHERVHQKLHYGFGCKHQADPYVLVLQKLPVALAAMQVSDTGIPMGDWGNS